MVPELRAGLVFGVLIAVALGGALALNRSSRTGVRFGGPAPVLGIAVIAGTLLTFAGRRPVPTGLVVGIVGIAAICAIESRRLGATVATALALPFAWAMTAGLELPTGGVRALLVVAAAAGAVAASRTEAEWGSTAITPVLLAITALAIYIAVPDTEEAGMLLGVALPMALLGWPLRLASLGRAGAGGVTVLVVWTAATGGRTDWGAIVAGCACLALLVGLGVGRYVATVDADIGARRRAAGSLLAVIVAQGGLALFASRVGGAGASLAAAYLVATITLASSVLIGARWQPPEA